MYIYIYAQRRETGEGDWRERAGGRREREGSRRIKMTNIVCRIKIKWKKDLDS
jgi:hypothetical protein